MKGLTPLLAFTRLNDRLDDFEGHGGFRGNFLRGFSIPQHAENNHRHRLTHINDMPVRIINPENALTPGLFAHRVNEPHAFTFQLLNQRVQVFGLKIDLVGF